jgi:hypothetical protein
VGAGYDGTVGKGNINALFAEVGKMWSRSVDTLKKWPVAPVSIIIGGEETEFVDLM